MMFYLLLLMLADKKPLPTPAINFSPRHYTAVFSAQAPTIDGLLDDPVWASTRFSELFIDIEGTARPAPLYDTQVALVFDDTYLFIAARLDEPHVWATLEKRDSIIFNDPDFEVFIDPDGDTHEYYELEVNALGTVWDLFLSKPYRDDGAALHDWNIPDLKVAVAVDGTINDPGDRDRGWSVEIAIPWEALKVCANKTIPPANGDTWRMNFSRVEWRIDTSDGSYRKRIDPTTQRAHAEYNWVWSPQGLINMHYPEMWGFVTFARGPLATKPRRVEEQAKWSLRQVYYAMHNFRAGTGKYAGSYPELKVAATEPEGYLWPPQIYVTPDLFQLVLPAKDKSHAWHLSSDGRIRRMSAP